MSAAETYRFQAGSNQGGNLWRETGEPSGQPVVPERPRSSILREWPVSIVVRNDYELERLPETVPLDLDGLCCFLEDNIDDFRYEKIVDRVRKGLPGARNGPKLGIVSMEGDISRVRNTAQILPVPEHNSSPVIASLRGWFAAHKFFMATSPQAQNLHEVDLTLGMPTDSGFRQDRVMLRVMEAAAREILDDKSSDERRAGKMLGYFGLLDYSRVCYLK